MPRHVVTGAPGTGKTTVLDRLADGYRVVPEPARQVIAAHRTETGEQNFGGRPAVFVERLLEKSINNYEQVLETEVTIFDRALPDCAAYALVSGVDPGACFEEARERRYASPVFLFPPWEEIYTTDDMRLATFSQIVDFHDAVVDVYEKLGYDLVEVPEAPVENRAAFIETML